MTDAIDWIGRAGAKAKGKRPKYFDDPATDRTMSIVMALVGEVSVLRERLDTVERLLDAKGTITRDYIARIMRGVQQDMEALAELDEPSVEELSKTLRDL